MKTRKKPRNNINKRPLLTIQTRRATLLDTPGKKKAPQEKAMRCTHDGTRTHNLALRRGTPYPFGHAGGTHAPQRVTKCCSAGGGHAARRVNRHLGRVVKAVDSKSTGLCPRWFESSRCRSMCFLFPLNKPFKHRWRFSGFAMGPELRELGLVV